MAISGVMIILMLLVPIGGIALQVFLSRQESPILGLILPVLTLLVSILAVSYAVVPIGGSPAGVILPIFVPLNFPTLVLLLIYFVCRRKYSRKKQMDKMNIQDLD
jgi:uncharacterized membrane protein